MTRREQFGRWAEARRKDVEKEIATTRDRLGLPTLSGATLLTGLHAHLSLDRPLIRKLGLSLEPLPHAERCVLGEVRVGNVIVVVGCSAHPALFWTFNFYIGGDLVDIFETGSGSLTTYWPKAEARARKLKGGQS